MDSVVRRRCEVKHMLENTIARRSKRLWGTSHSSTSSETSFFTSVRPEIDFILRPAGTVSSSLNDRLDDVLDTSPSFPPRSSLLSCIVPVANPSSAPRERRNPTSLAAICALCFLNGLPTKFSAGSSTAPGVGATTSTTVVSPFPVPLEISSSFDSGVRGGVEVVVGDRRCCEETATTSAECCLLSFKANTA